MQPWASGRTLPPPKVQRSADQLAAKLAEHYGRDPVEVDVEMLKAVTDRPDGPETPVGRKPRKKSGGQS